MNTSHDTTEDEGKVTTDLGDNRSEWPEVAVIILNWNNYEDTVECLNSLEQIEYPNFRVIVVDNGSSDGSGEQLAEDYPWCTFVWNDENLGFTGGNNVAIQKAMSDGADHVLLLNNDTVVTKGFLTTMVSVIESVDDIGLAGPVIRGYGTADIDTVGGVIDMRTGSHTALRDYPETKEGFFDVEYLSGACLLISEDVIDTVGVLDEDYFMYTEDVDYSLRAQRSGFRIVAVTNSTIWHKGSEAEHKLLTGGGTLPPSYELYYSIRNNMLFMRKHADMKQLLTYVPYHVARTVVKTGHVLLQERDIKKAMAPIRGLAWHLMN